jgi:hypothetical protein
VDGNGEVLIMESSQTPRPPETPPPAETTPPAVDVPMPEGMQTPIERMGNFVMVAGGAVLINAIVPIFAWYDLGSIESTELFLLEDASVSLLDVSTSYAIILAVLGAALVVAGRFIKQGGASALNAARAAAGIGGAVLLVTILTLASPPSSFDVEVEGDTVAASGDALSASNGALIGIFFGIAAIALGVLLAVRLARETETTG